MTLLERLDQMIAEGWASADEIEASVELHRLHAELDDYKKTCDELIRSSCNDQAEIVKLEAQRDELLEALEVVIYWDNGKPEWADARAAMLRARDVL